MGGSSTVVLPSPVLCLRLPGLLLLLHQVLEGGVGEPGSDLFMFDFSWVGLGSDGETEARPRGQACSPREHSLP